MEKKQKKDKKQKKQNKTKQNTNLFFWRWVSDVKVHGCGLREAVDNHGAHVATPTGRRDSLNDQLAKTLVRFIVDGVVRGGLKTLVVVQPLYIFQRGLRRNCTLQGCSLVHQH